MTKRGDGPTTRRMGFGYQQARAAGAPFRNERAPRSLNAERIYQEVEQRTLNFNLAPIPQYPDAKAYARRSAKRGLTADQIIALLNEKGQEVKKAKLAAGIPPWASARWLKR